MSKFTEFDAKKLFKLYRHAKKKDGKRDDEGKEKEKKKKRHKEKEKEKVVKESRSSVEKTERVPGDKPDKSGARSDKSGSSGISYMNGQDKPGQPSHNYDNSYDKGRGYNNDRYGHSYKNRPEGHRHEGGRTDSYRGVDGHRGGRRGWGNNYHGGRERDRGYGGFGRYNHHRDSFGNGGYRGGGHQGWRQDRRHEFDTQRDNHEIRDGYEDFRSRDGYDCSSKDGFSQGRDSENTRDYDGVEVRDAQDA